MSSGRSTELCGMAYARPGGEVLGCQYIAGHPTERHSWFAVKEQDDHDILANIQRQQAPSDEKELLERIEAGIYDSVLEALLNAAHNRKRTIRGVRGFPRLERRRA